MSEARSWDWSVCVCVSVWLQWDIPYLMQSSHFTCYILLFTSCTVPFASAFRGIKILSFYHPHPYFKHVMTPDTSGSSHRSEGSRRCCWILLGVAIRKPLQWRSWHWNGPIWPALLKVPKWRQDKGSSLRNTYYIHSFGSCFRHLCSKCLSSSLVLTWVYDLYMY